MAIPDANVHGLVDVALAWNPRSMRKDPVGARALDALNAAVADALNPLIDLEGYVPLVLSPIKCLDADVDRLLTMEGIEKDRALGMEQARRLAVIGYALRSWRGAFRSLRSVIGALTGGPSLIRPWLVQRMIVGESSWDLVILPLEGFERQTQVFLLGTGPDAHYNSALTETYVDKLARTAVDETDYVPCYAVTSWRDGFAGWGAQGDVELVPSSVRNEYDSTDIGPGVGSSSTEHRLTAPTSSYDGMSRHWATTWFKTADATDGSYWRMLVASDAEASATAYAVVVCVGNYEVSVVRMDAGVDTVLGTLPAMVSDGDAGDWHRIDIVVSYGTGQVMLRAYIDHSPTGVFYDLAPSPPSGVKLEVLLSNVEFSTGRLRIAALTAKN